MRLTHAQETIRDSLRAFARELMAPCAGERDKCHTFSHEAQRELAALVSTMSR